MCVIRSKGVSIINWSFLQSPFHVSDFLTSQLSRGCVLNRFQVISLSISKQACCFIIFYCHRFTWTAAVTLACDRSLVASARKPVVRGNSLHWFTHDKLLVRTKCCSLGAYRMLLEVRLAVRTWALNIYFLVPYFCVLIRNSLYLNSLKCHVSRLNN